MKAKDNMKAKDSPFTWYSYVAYIKGAIMSKQLNKNKTTTPMSWMFKFTFLPQIY